mgnify:CR=1 FL=1
MDRRQGERSHKLDLYSIPVFFLELLVLTGLGYSAYYLHFQHNHDPFVSGFYCDDISYRQQYLESKLTQHFSKRHNEITIVILLLTVPLVFIIFCELVNSMFGALKFRQIRALCTCCKLHSITRRSIRFSGAYVLGFLMVMISCDILASGTGRLRPYFAQECPTAYGQCATLQAQGRDLTMLPSSIISTPGAPSRPKSIGDDSSPALANDPPIVPASPPISATSQGTKPTADPQPLVIHRSISGSESSGTRQRREAGAPIVERQWIDLTGQNLTELCRFSGGDEASYKFEKIAMSWPSFPAAIIVYACMFSACYLSFVGTARPFRIITCVLAMLLLLTASLSGMQLVKDHFNHWDDVAASAILAFVIVTFVLIVYLNKFKDTHYYENQKLPKNRLISSDNFRSYTNDIATGQYELNKVSSGLGNGAIQNTDAVGSVTNNDLAMRYFQIPRANYRGTSRPSSTVNQIR